MSQTKSIPTNGDHVYYPHHGVMQVAETEPQTYGGITIECVKLTPLDGSVVQYVPASRFKQHPPQRVTDLVQGDTIERVLKCITDAPQDRTPPKKVLEERLAAGPLSWAELIRDLNRHEERTFTNQQYLSDAAKRLRDVLAVTWQRSAEEAAAILNDHLRKRGKPILHFRRFGTLERSWNAR